MCAVRCADCGATLPLSAILCWCCWLHCTWCRIVLHLVPCSVCRMQRVSAVLCWHDALRTVLIQHQAAVLLGDANA